MIGSKLEIHILFQLANEAAKSPNKSPQLIKPTENQNEFIEKNQNDVMA